jgi:hypothetical protein
MDGGSSMTAAPQLDTLSLIARTKVYALTQRREFRHVDRFCLFVGQPRSGTTLFGSLLNAHREIVIGHEADLLRYARKGITRRQLYAIVYDFERQFAKAGRQWNGFDYALPDLDQGRFGAPRVIGDKKAALTARRLADDPALLDRLRSVVGVPLRVFNIVRNPFNTIASMARNRGESVADAILRYQRIDSAVERTIGLFDSGEVLNLRFEEFTVDPRSGISAACTFLGVDSSERYLERCSSIVTPGGRHNYEAVRWSAEEVTSVQRLIEIRPVLAGYQFPTHEE